MTNGVICDNIPVQFVIYCPHEDVSREDDCSLVDPNFLHKVCITGT